jgi:tetratricopeptide (TPR) repeat protein
MISPSSEVTEMKPTRRGILPTTAVAVAMLLLALGSACDGDGDRRAVTQLAEPGEVNGDGGERISQQLMVALAQAKNFHHRAKVYMSDGNATEAIASVRRILSLRFPLNAPEADDVRADARALLAKLMIGRGNLDEAARIVDEGLANATRDSFFIANLYTVKGEIHEAQAALAEAQGEPGKAAAASFRHEAIEAYDRSIRINSAIQQRLLESVTP